MPKSYGSGSRPKLTKKELKASRLNGEHFGFPKCCIDYYCNHVNDDNWEQYMLRNSHNSLGYVPCPKCAPAVKAVVMAFKREMRMLFPSKDLCKRLAKGIPL